MKIAIASDHAGYELKEDLKRFLTEKGDQFFDFGTVGTDSVDYPDFAKEVANAVAFGQFERGILVCGSGIGMAMAANKVKGIRAAVCNDLECASLSRKHNDANILALGSRLVAQGQAEKIVELWLSTNFEAGRHVGRVNKIAQIENDQKDSRLGGD
ncbi:MAG: ribose 5-phosphate isomerase B [Actinomycetota bacterium]|nr:ribose 5-phosphate isomerase B [Actinomycetota bacterium]